MYTTLPCDDGQWNHAWAGHDIVDVEATFNLNRDDEPELLSLTFYDADGLSLRLEGFTKRVSDQFDAWCAGLDRAERNQLHSDEAESRLSDMVESEIDWHKEQSR